MGGSLSLFSLSLERPLASFAAKEEFRLFQSRMSSPPPNSHSSSLLFSNLTPQSSRETLGLEPFGEGEEEERETRFKKRGGGREGKEEKGKERETNSSRQSKAIEQREQQKQSTRTGPLPGQAAPERDVGQHAGEGRCEGHERGCVERHWD